MLNTYADDPNQTNKSVPMPPKHTSFFTNGNTIQVLALTEWLDMAAGKHPAFGVDLPMIQRGFVWKPQQIIDLWDSLLSGMPIGALMVSEMQQGDARVALTPNGKHTYTAAQRLGLVDGQQRTLAMLMGWRAFTAGTAQHRLWVDLADEPAPGHHVRLRISTRHQPFGYQRIEPNRKLSLDDRRRSRKAFETVAAQDLLEKAQPHPAGAKHSIPLDFGKLVQEWHTLQNPAAWKKGVWEALQSVKTFAMEGDRAVLKLQWDALDQAQQDAMKQRLEKLAAGLQHVFNAQIPLVRVAPELFSPDSETNIEPPLARLFQRVGSNATPLLDADYIYSVLKHLMPEVHDMVQSLHAHSTVAGFLTATDLVMSALRLAAVQWKDVTDFDNPGKEDFHRMVIRPQNADAKQRQTDLKALLGNEDAQTLQRYFDTVQANLAYRPHKADEKDKADAKDKADDTGLPPLMLPYLGRPLVQVLLRLAQAGFLQNPVNETSRAQALRLVLWWMRWVWDKPKASRIAFQVIEESTDHADLDLRIAQAIVQDGRGMAMQPPAAIAALGLHQADAAALIGEERFATPEDDSEKNRHIRSFYRHWWQHWSHQHPMLLWLQRDYVSRLEAEPLAGMDEDTPYDFDHILPSAHWAGDWRTVGRTGTVEDFRYARGVLGNSIGNIRVWDASHNRSDGDASPNEKLANSGDQKKQDQWLTDSAIDGLHQAHWEACSPSDPEAKAYWDRPRALAFQSAVVLRAYALYEQLYRDAGFTQWECS